MGIEITLKYIIVALEITLSLILIGKWFKTNVRFLTDLPFLFGMSILFVGLSGIIDLIYLSFPFTTELLIYQIRGVIICLTGTTMLTAILRIWFFDKLKIVFLGGFLYFGSFLTIVFISTTPEQIVAYTNPLIGINIILVIVTFAITYLKKRLPTINSPLIILGALTIMIGQIVGIPTLNLNVILLPEILNMAGWIIFTSGFLLKAPYYKELKVANF
ncbi:MAG: hypothetical protein ACTSYR_01210 [Candidatus Odinarchaeia archaeon]